MLARGTKLLSLQKKEGVVNKNWQHKVQTLQSVHILNENG